MAKINVAVQNTLTPPVGKLKRSRNFFECETNRGGRRQ
jgi:hypothetical protein